MKKQSSAAKGEANSIALQPYIYIQPIKEIGNTPILSSKPFAVCCFFVPLIGKVLFFAGYFVGKVYSLLLRHLGVERPHGMDASSMRSPEERLSLQQERGI